MKKVYIFGAGGHAANCIDVFLARAEFEPVIISREPIDGQKWPCDDLTEDSAPWADIKNVFVALGDNFQRNTLTVALKERLPAATFLQCIHPSVSIGFGTTIEDGVYIGAGSVVGPRCRIGENSLVNCGVIIEHDSEFGQLVNIGTASGLGGGVRIGHRSVIGVGTKVIHGIRIGEDVLLASGACVVKDVGDGQVMLGVPAVCRRTRKFGDRYL